MPLLRWVLAWWRSERLALAVDPTSKKDDSVAIVISVLYRGCAVPVAWRILRANKPGAWMDPIVELLRELAPAVPRKIPWWCCVTGASPVRNCDSRYAPTAGTLT